MAVQRFTVNASGITLRSLNDGEMTIRPIHGIDTLRVTHTAVVYIAQSAQLTVRGNMATYVRRIMQEPTFCTRRWFVEEASAQTLRYFRVHLDTNAQPLPHEEHARFELRCVPLASLV